MSRIPARRERVEHPANEGVYLLHWTPPIAGRARHYIGSATNIRARIAAHEMGMGARICAAAMRMCPELELARVWRPGEHFDNTYTLRSWERVLKGRKNAAQLCPICRAEKSATCTQ